MTATSQRRRADVLHWMDQWIELLLVFVASAAIPLLIVETGAPDAGDASLVVAGSWLIWGTFTLNLLVRLVLASDRLRQLTWLAPDVVLVVGQPLLSIGERKASPVLALVPLAAVAFRAVLKGRLLRRTGHKLRSHPLRVVATVVPFMWLLSASLIYRYERESGVISSFGDGLWWSAVTLATVGYGDISPKTTPGRYVGVGAMVVGIGMFSVVTAQLAERLVAQRRSVGRTEVLEQGHTIILGWSPMVATIVSELLLANRSRRDASIVVLADRDTEDMYADLAAHVRDLDHTNTTVVCRSGNPADTADLRRCRPHDARSIIVIDENHDDAVVARCLLALAHADPPVPSIPIVAEIDDPAIAAAINHALPGRIIVVNPVAFIARTAAQACLAAGVGLTYQELLGVDGSEMYVQQVAGTEGRRFGEIVTRFADACPIGVRFADGSVDLCPPADTVIGPGDQLAIVAIDDSQIELDGAPVDVAPMPGPVVGRHADPVAPLHVVVLGWNELAPIVLDELDDFLAPGSRITIGLDPDAHGVSASIEALQGNNTEVVVRKAGGAAFADLVEVVTAERADHVIVLCRRDGMSASEADTRAMLTTLQVRRLVDAHGRGTTVVTELRDQNDVDLAPPSSAGNFIVSDKLVSLLLTQMSEDRDLHPVFVDLLDPEGAEIYCKPARWYGITGAPVSFGSLAAAGVERGDCVIGYRRLAEAESPESAFGIAINPRKDTIVDLGPDDEVIVIADDAG